MSFFVRPNAIEEGMPPSADVVAAADHAARVGRRKAINSVAIVLIPAAPIAEVHRDAHQQSGVSNSSARSPSAAG